MFLTKNEWADQAPTEESGGSIKASLEGYAALYTQPTSQQLCSRSSSTETFSLLGLDYNKTKGNVLVFNNYIFYFTIIGYNKIIF